MTEPEILLYHDNHPAIVFPQRIPGVNRKGQVATIDRFGIQCETCKIVQNELHGTVHDVLACLEFDITAHCDKCNNVTHVKARVYPDMRIVMRDEDGWGSEEQYPGRWHTFLNKLRGL